MTEIPNPPKFCFKTHFKHAESSQNFRFIIYIKKNHSKIRHFQKKYYYMFNLL